jgi:hypothetical protein
VQAGSGSATWMACGGGEEVPSGSVQQQQQQPQCLQQGLGTSAGAYSVLGCDSSMPVRAPAVMEADVPDVADAYPAAAAAAGAAASSQWGLGLQAGQPQQQGGFLVGPRHSSAHEMTDPLLGSVFIPPIQTVLKGKLGRGAQLQPTAVAFELSAWYC